MGADHLRQPSDDQTVSISIKGQPLGCADEQNALWKIATDGSLEVIKLAIG
jgi:hypothetical protein